MQDIITFFDNLNNINNNKKVIYYKDNYKIIENYTLINNEWILTLSARKLLRS